MKTPPKDTKDYVFKMDDEFIDNLREKISNMDFSKFKIPENNFPTDGYLKDSFPTKGYLSNNPFKDYKFKDYYIFNNKPSSTPKPCKHPENSLYVSGYGKTGCYKCSCEDISI